MIWKNMRADIETWRRLESYRLRLQAAVRRCPGRYPDIAGKATLSLGDAINVLLESQEGRARRGRKSRDNQACTYTTAPDNMEAAPATE